MDFLTLVQTVHRESGSGGIAPTSLVGLKGENLRLQNWVAQADLEIQERHSDWQFLWSQTSITLEAGVNLYYPFPNGALTVIPGSSVAEYDRDSFFLDGSRLPVVNYLDVKREPLATDVGRPYRCVLMPSDTLRFDPPPDQAYSVQFDVWRTPIMMLQSADETPIPARFHLAIVGLALQKYAKFENAPEILQAGADMYAHWLMKLEADQLPGDRYMHSKSEDNMLDMYSD